MTTEPVTKKRMQRKHGISNRHRHQLKQIDSNNDVGPKKVTPTGYNRGEIAAEWEAETKKTNTKPHKTLDRVLGVIP
jgi:hypothetical protein